LVIGFQVATIIITAVLPTFLCLFGIMAFVREVKREVGQGNYASRRGNTSG